MSGQVEVKLRGSYVRVCIEQIERQSQQLVKSQKAPGMAIELVMAQFVACGMFITKHVSPGMCEELFKDMMSNRLAIENTLESKTEAMINKAVKDAANER